MTDFPAPGSRLTLLDIAREAGVSRTTVSNAFNRPDQLSDQLRQRVLATAVRLGYGGPNPAARMLRKGRTGAVGLVFPDPLPHAFSDDAAIGFLRGVAAVCERERAALLILPADEPGRLARRVREAPVDGLIVYCCADDSPVLEAVAERRLPVVAVEVGRFAHGPHVRVDDEGGARQAACHLLAGGHRRFAVLALEFLPDGYEGLVDEARIRTASFAVTQRRLRGYRAALQAGGIDPRTAPVLEILRNDPNSAERFGRAILEARPRPTAILAMSDMLALGALRAARACGLDVPTDLSVVGFDDVPLASAFVPAITTVRQPLVAKGRRAAELLFQGAPPCLEVLSTELIVRATTGLAPA